MTIYCYVVFPPDYSPFRVHKKDHSLGEKNACSMTEGEHIKDGMG